MESELLFAFDLFLKDVDDVRSGVLQHIGEFLKYVSPTTRENYLPVLCEMVSRTTPTNWRPREILAYQLPDLLGLFSPQSTHTVISPLCFALLEDAVAMVRERTFKGFGPLIDRFGEEHAEWRDAVLNRLLSLADSDSSFKRQIFLHVAVHLARSSLTQESYIAHILPHLARLAFDPVVLLRIAFARNLLDYPDWVLHHPSMLAALEAMDHEATKDVRHFMSVFKHRKPSIGESLGSSLEVMPLVGPASVIKAMEIKAEPTNGGLPAELVIEAVHGAGGDPPTTTTADGDPPVPDNGEIKADGGDGDREVIISKEQEVKPEDVVLMPDPEVVTPIDC